MAESLTDNLVDLLAGMPEENSIPSGEDTTGVNLKCKLGRDNSAGYSDVHKRVQLELDQREYDDSEMSDDDGMAWIPTAMQSILTKMMPILMKMMSLLALLYPIKDLGRPTMEGRTHPNTLSLSHPVTAAD